MSSCWNRLQLDFHRYHHWLSAADRSDTLHEEGRAVIKALAEEKLPKALTTDFETLTLLRGRGIRSPEISNAARNILSSSLVRVVYVDKFLFEESLANFKKYERLSFTDSVSLAVIRKHRVREIYSHDSVFDLKGLVRKERP